MKIFEQTEHHRFKFIDNLYDPEESEFSEIAKFAILLLSDIKEAFPSFTIKADWHCDNFKTYPAANITFETKGISVHFYPGHLSIRANYGQTYIRLSYDDPEMITEWYYAIHDNLTSHHAPRPPKSLHMNPRI